MQFHSSSYLCALRFQPLRSGPSSYLSSKFFIEFNLRLRHFDLTNPFREEKNIKAAWSTFKRHRVRFFFLIPIPGSVTSLYLYISYQTDVSWRRLEQRSGRTKL